MGLFKFGLILDSARIIAAFERKSKAHSFEDEPAQQWRQAETGSKVWGRQIEMDHPRFQFLNGKEGRERDGERETFKVPHCLREHLQDANLTQMLTPKAAVHSSSSPPTCYFCRLFLSSLPYYDFYC